MSMTKENALYEVIRTKHREVQNAEAARARAVYECFPVGMLAFWNHGKGIARVKVTRHGYEGMLFIENTKTGKTRRVDGWDTNLTL